MHARSRSRLVLLASLTALALSQTGCPPPVPGPVAVRPGGPITRARWSTPPRALVERLKTAGDRRLELPLRPGAMTVLDGARVRPIGRRWHVVASGGGEASLVIDGDRVHGIVNVDGASYALHGTGDDVEIEQLDMTRQRRDREPIATGWRGAPQALHGVAGADDHPTHDVLVVYTPGAEAQLAVDGVDVASWVDAAIDDANLAYEDSAIGQRLALAHLAPVSYTEAADIDDDLGRLQATNDGRLDDVHALRDRYGADLVVMLRADHPDFCGVANLAVISSDADDDSAFAVVSVSGGCRAKWTFTHELGHIAGAHHNASNDPSGTYYAHGHQSPEGRWRTMMAYDCDTSCPRIRRFSNNDQTYTDGRALGDTNADNARRLNETAITLEGFRLRGPRVSLYEGNRGEQDHVCVVSADAESSLTFGGADLRYCDNDEARSLKLFAIPAGRVVRLYDSPRGDTQDDWVEIVAKRDLVETLVPSFERSYQDDDVRVTYHRNNGLDGKVSRLQISAAASGPRIDLHEGNRASQNLVCSLPVAAAATVRFPGHDECDNDEARSLTLHDVPAGTVLRLFDDPDGSTGDDWTEITVRRDVARRVLASLETDVDDADLRVVHHHDDGLDGKLSRVVIGGAVSTAAIDLYEGNRATQDLLCSLPATPGTATDLSRSGGCANDEARSARLLRVPAGTVVMLYDAPGGGRGDDWTAIVARQDLRDTTIDSFEQQVDRPDLAVLHFHDNGLDGKVSRVEVTRADLLAGIATFHEGNRGTQNKVCDLDLTSRVVRFKSSSTCDNDEARSLTLTLARPGVTVEVYDDPDCRTSDDWTRIRTKRAFVRRTIDSFATSFSDDDLEVTHHHDNGLDGKVSCVRIY